MSLLDLRQYIEEMARALDPAEEDREFLCNHAIRRIKERTAKGVDSDENPFAPYADDRPAYKNRIRYESYAEYKKAVTGSTTVNLFDQGSMVGALQRRHDTPPDEFAFGIYDTKLAIIGGAHNEGALAGRNHTSVIPRRHWFDLSESDMDFLGTAYEGRVVSRIERL